MVKKDSIGMGRKIARCIFISSMTFIALCALCSLLFAFLPLEFSNDVYSSAYDEVQVLGLSATILLTLTGTIKCRDGVGRIILKIVLTFAVLGIFITIRLANALSGLCTWSNGDVLFQDKDHAAIQIIERDYGCGAVDNTSAVKKTFLLNNLTFFLVWVAPIDTATIDKEKWMRWRKVVEILPRQRIP
jgi:hypothetical protein